MTPDGHRAVSASYDKTLSLLESGQTLHSFEGHTDWINAVAVTADSRRAISASNDQTLRLWDLKSGKEIATFTGESAICSFGATLDGRTIVAGESSGQVLFLRLVETDETKP